jgi:hypothetical protein
MGVSNGNIRTSLRNEISYGYGSNYVNPFDENPTRKTKHKSLAPYCGKFEREDDLYLWRLHILELKTKLCDSVHHNVERNLKGEDGDSFWMDGD